MDTAQLLWGLLFSSIGMGFFLYGKKQKRSVPLICGLILIVYPYVISNVPALIALGVGLTIVPYFIRR